MTEKLPNELHYENIQSNQYSVDFYYDGEFQYSISSELELDNIRLKSLELDVADKVSFKSGDKELTFNEYSVPNSWSKIFSQQFNVVANILKLQTQKRKQKQNETINTMS